jgi:predicted MFS family arabinose efflux permease
VGPALAGILIGAAGEGACFLVNAASYVPVLLALKGMRLPERPLEDDGAGVIDSLRRGVSYLSGRPDMSRALLLLGWLSLAGLPVVMALMPVFARDVLGAGPRALGWLMSAVGTGAIGGALLLAARPAEGDLDRMIGRAAAGFGAALLLLASCRTLPAALAAAALAGLGMMSCFAGVNTLLQTRTDERMRGRVMSLFSMTFLGVAPLGSLLAGLIADRFGAPTAALAGGAACLLAGLRQWRAACQN